MTIKQRITNMIQVHVVDRMTPRVYVQTVVLTVDKEKYQVQLTKEGKIKDIIKL